MSEQSQCFSGSVVVNTTKTPFIIGDEGIYYKGGLYLTLNSSIISHHDIIEITKALNGAYKIGYEAAISDW
jgi:hypothetical protein